ncbi:MAG: type II toxin-antitoxin system VapC family toxin [Ignavibacteriae bacterium]|nr:type II toxin-antitoxin system VapC family toxin [Ignavibacteriota bacterium]
MNLVDSSGWLEYFTDSKNAKYFAPVIENKDELIISVINLYEVYKKVMSAKSEKSANEACSVMMQAKVIDLDASLSLSASNISCKYKIPMADSLIYVTAQFNDAIVWTQDYDFIDLPGVKFIKKN